MTEQKTQPDATPPAPVAAQRKGINVIDRAKNILITPKDEWPVVDKEKFSTSAILTSYILPMLSIGAIATFIGQGLIGKSLGPYGGNTASVKAGLIGALLFVILTIITVYIVAAAIDALAQSFSSEKNWIKSFQLAAYSLTASYVGAIFLLFPALNIVAILCTVYSIYPLYTGIPNMKKTPVDKTVAYLAVVILITIVAVILVGIIQAEVIKSFNRPKNPFGGFNFGM
ncbi:MAG TPA: Yip1 family protein [Chitinophagaceae bacterium]|nr:Yip1 family protein [Chitinophagaceae bacterium]